MPAKNSQIMSSFQNKSQKTNDRSYEKSPSVGILPSISEKLDLLDLNSVCSEFISKNQNRKTFFGHE